jgi:hypothetical protein
MALTINHDQRNAIYELVVDHLSAIGDVWIEFERRDFATAKRQAGEFVQGLRLLTDLGWDETIDAERVTLTVPNDELVTILAWLHRKATGALESYVSRPRDDEAVAERDLTAVTTLGELLGQLAAASHACAGNGAEGSRCRQRPHRSGRRHHQRQPNRSRLRRLLRLAKPALAHPNPPENTPVYAPVRHSSPRVPETTRSGPYRRQSSKRAPRRDRCNLPANRNDLPR